MIQKDDLKRIGFNLDYAYKNTFTYAKKLNDYTDEYEDKKISLYVHFIGERYDSFQLYMEDDIMLHKEQWFSLFGIKTIADIEKLIQLIVGVQ